MKRKLTVMLLALAMVMTFMPMTAFAGIFDRSDAGNTYLKAKSIALDELVSDKLSKAVDVDYFKFTPDRYGAVSIQFFTDSVQKDNRAYWEVTLLKKEKLRLTTVDSMTVYGNELSKSMAWNGLGYDSYYIRVRKPLDLSSGFSKDEYSICAAFAEGDQWECEPDDNARDAIYIDVNSERFGSIFNAADEDYYMFSLEQPGFAELSFTAGKQDSGDNYWAVDLLDSSQKMITTFHVSGNRDSYKAPFVGLDAGTYYLRIYADEALSIDPYSLYISFADSDGWERELNDSPKYADRFEMGNYIIGTLMHEYDADYYWFDVEESGNYDINAVIVGQKSDDNFYHVSLFNNDMEDITDFLIKGSTTTASITQQLAGGRYYVRVEASDLWTEDVYMVGAAVHEEPPAPERPAKVTGLKVKAGKKKATVTWNEADNADGYQVCRCTTKYGTYTAVKSTTATKFVNKNLKKGKTYYYKVRAYRIVDGERLYGNFSAIKKVKIKK